MKEQLDNQEQDVTTDSAVAELEEPLWYVLRDLKRSNAKLPAYRQLSEAGFEVFTPMRWVITKKNGQSHRRLIPYLQDLLFVHSTREVLDKVVARTKTLQYRFVRGGGYCNPMVVRDEDMSNFIAVARSSSNPKYLQVEEITPQMIGRRVRVIGGPLNQREGYLQSIRGTRVKHLLVKIDGLIAVRVEVQPEFLEFIK